MTAVLLLQVASTWAMVGIIWVIQVLQYPQLADVPAASFPEFERQHQRRIALVLALFAPIEIVTALWLFLDPGGIPRWMPLVGGLLLAGIWISTALFYAPIHGSLTDGFDPALHRSLVRWNWARTAAWSLRGMLVLAMVASLL
ncbi:MAG: hypothetical protein QNJ71_07350 [Acidimicrobiia bacterium]|nr:hypothetical protein [Acidimicrobiia bacterium]